MRPLHFLLLLVLPATSWANAVLTCPAGTMRTWTQSLGHSCMPRMMLTPQEAIGCFPQTNLFPNFPGPLFPTHQMPWWAYQGNLYYPNLHYPGPWAWPGIQARYFPGQGEVFAAKPNVYIESIHEKRTFDFRFTSKEKLSFLATTPPVDRHNSWKGKLVKDRFEVEGIFYDYLFYDIRLPKDKIQLEHGLCATREGAIEWMLMDLKEMRYPDIALQDFEEHWRVKIPDYPIYCVYPQYNQQLDEVLPVDMGVEQASFTRALYLLVPHKVEPNINEPQAIPLPTKDPSLIRPDTKIVRENMFKEWGVAFLGHD